MTFKGITVGAACVIMLALIAIWFLFRRADPPPRLNTNQIIAINKLLYKLRKECITGHVDVAQNTLEDVKQEWEYLDVILQGRTTCPSDSLQTLDSLVRLMLNKDDSKRLLPIALSKINALNNRLDKVR